MDSSVVVLLPGFFVPGNQWRLDGYRTLGDLFRAGCTVQALRVADSREDAEALAKHLNAFGGEAIVAAGGDMYLDDLVEKCGGGWPEKGDFGRAMKAAFVVVLLTGPEVPTD